MSRKAATEDEAEGKQETKTCFVIMPISDVDGYPAGHFSEVYKQLIEPAVTSAGYICSLATSTTAAHLIQLEVVTRVATADLCICDLSTNNPNVLFEYGIRQAFDKPTVLVKDNLTRRIFDLTGFRDIEYDHTLRIANILSARETIRSAIEETVRGNESDDQVFSLVKLMKLTKAALPAGEISQGDAKFALLEQKIDRLLRNFDRTQVEKLGVTDAVGDNILRVGVGVLKFIPEGVEYTPRKNLMPYFYLQREEFFRSEIYQSLNDYSKRIVQEKMDRFCTDMIPF